MFNEMEKEESPRGEMEIISDLMEELQDYMQLGEDDFSERLGRPKPEGMPEVASIEIEAKGEMPEEMLEDEMGATEDDLKKRLLKLKG